jgi:hypothetical protein
MQERNDLIIQHNNKQQGAKPKHIHTLSSPLVGNWGSASDANVVSQWLARLMLGKASPLGPLPELGSLK